VWPPKQLRQKPAKAAAAVSSFLADLNAEMGMHWELRAYPGATKPHRRFLVYKTEASSPCGLSLNNMNKDEALDNLSAGADLAEYDRNFFDNCWISAKPL
jgi:hypothetical protein